LKVTFYSKENPSEKFEANAIVRMKKDSIFWMSITKFGKEAAKLKITPDSSYFIQKYPDNDKYYSTFKTAEYFHKLGLDIVISDFQQLLFGNFSIKPVSSDKITNEGGRQRVIMNRNGVSMDFVIDISKNKLEEISAKKELSGEIFNIQFVDYELINSNLIPKKIKISTKTKVEEVFEENVMEVEFSNSEFVTDNLSFNFTVPEGYEKR
jgi:hypothetical protein